LQQLLNHVTPRNNAAQMLSAKIMTSIQCITSTRCVAAIVGATVAIC